MKKTSVIVLSLLLLILFAGNAMAEESNISDRIRVTKESKRMMSGNEELPANASMTEVGGWSSLGSPKGQQVGTTQYEYQHNGSMGRQIAYSSLTGVIHVDWMYRQTALGCRSIRYASSTNAGANWGPVTDGKDVTPVTPTCAYGGYTTMDVTSTGQAVIACHYDDLSVTGTDYFTWVSVDQNPPLGIFATWDRGNNGPNCQGTVSGETETNEYIWPVVDVQNIGGTNYAHMITSENATTGAGTPDISSIIYYRVNLSTNSYDECSGSPGDTLGTYIDESDVTAAVVRSDPNPASQNVAIVISRPYYPDTSVANADCSALVSNQYMNDIVYYESTNGGLSFEDGTASFTNVTDYTAGGTLKESEIPFRGYTDLSALYDSDGFLHIVWSTSRWDISGETLADKCQTQLYESRLWHYTSDPSSPCAISLCFDGTEPRYFLPGPDASTFGTFNLGCAKMNISECDGNLYVSFTRFGAHTSPSDGDSVSYDYSDNPYSNGDILLTASSDGGQTWGPDPAAAGGVEGNSHPWNVRTATDVTNTITNDCTAGNCKSEHWSSMAKYSTGSVHIFYVEDHDAGAAIRDPAEGELTTNPMIYVGNDCFTPSPAFSYSVLPHSIFVPIAPQGGVDCTIDETTTFELQISNSGNVPVNYTATAGSMITPASQSGTITAGCDNVEIVTFTVGPVATEGTYSSSVSVALSSTAGNGNEVIPVDIIVRCKYYVPEYTTLSTTCWSVGAWNVPRSGTNLETNLGNMYWFEDSIAPLFDNGVVISYVGDPTKTYFSVFDGSDSAMGFEPLGFVTYSTTGTYEKATGEWCTPDTAITGYIEYYCPIHPDTCVLIERFWLINTADTTVRVNVGEAIDWDIPDSTDLAAAGSANIGGADASRQMVYQTGPDRPWAPDLIDHCGGARFVDPIEAAICLENDRYIYPNGGYFPDTLGILLSTMTGFTVDVPDSVEDRNCVYSVAKNVVLEPGECVAYCKVKASSLIGVGRFDGTDNGTMFNLIDKGVQWATDHYLNYCPGPLVVATPSAFTFSGTEGGSNPATQNLSISNVGDPTLNWTVSNNESWLSLAPTSGSGAGSTTLTVDITSLTVGTYYDTVTVSDPNAPNSPVEVPVELTINPAPTCMIGDADQSGAIDIDDIVYLIAYAFTGGPPPIPEVCCGDADGSGAIDIDDIVYLIAYAFTGGPPPDPDACVNWPG